MIRPTCPAVTSLVGQTVTGVGKPGALNTTKRSYKNNNSWRKNKRNECLISSCISNTNFQFPVGGLEVEFFKIFQKLKMYIVSDTLNLLHLTLTDSYVLQKLSFLFSRLK